MTCMCDFKDVSASIITSNLNHEYVHRACASNMCIEDTHVDLTRRRRYMNIQHGGSIRLVNVHGEHAGMLVLLNLGSDLAILVLCGPVVCAR